MTKRLHIQYHRKDDGRALYLYGWQAHDLEPLVPPAQPPYPPTAITPGTLNWHPLLETYVTTSPHRQNRTFRPELSDCPFCPSTADRLNEVPFADFDLAVFDNRFPAFVPADQAIPFENPALQPAQGKCELVVYSADHQATMGTLDDTRRALLIEAWVHRYDTLLGLPDIQFVLPFENRGEEIGATLSHPHGQIYALPFLPPVTATMAQSFKKDSKLLVKAFDKHRDLILDEEDGIIAFIPRFGQFSYEIWLAPREPRAGLWAFGQSERKALARLLGKTARAYDALFGQRMPYIMAVQSAPLRFEKTWHSHITFQPFLRTADKLKYIAGVEVTAGHYLKDVTAEEAYQKIKPLFDGDKA
ncbi:MAG TPA: galactose-1-phosphate uridylyltransferase [Alphaproteobacteria bacterium]